MSEAVYNFQRIFNLKMGFGSREHDQIPYRAMGPVTVEEYESRQEQYEKLQDAVYKRRGWTPQGIPTLETVKRLGINFPEVVELMKAHGVE